MITTNTSLTAGPQEAEIGIVTKQQEEGKTDLVSTVIASSPVGKRNGLGLRHAMCSLGKNKLLIEPRNEVWQISSVNGKMESITPDVCCLEHDTTTRSLVDITSHVSRHSLLINPDHKSCDEREEDDEKSFASSNDDEELVGGQHHAPTPDEHSSLPVATAIARCCEILLADNSNKESIDVHIGRCNSKQDDANTTTRTTTKDKKEISIANPFLREIQDLLKLLSSPTFVGIISRRKYFYYLHHDYQQRKNKRVPPRSSLPIKNMTSIDGGHRGVHRLRKTTNSMCCR